GLCTLLKRFRSCSLCNSIRLRRISSSERAAPAIIDFAAGILGRFGAGAKTRKHRVYAPLKLAVALQYGFSHALIFAFGTQGLKLGVEVEHDSGPEKAAGFAGSARVQADREKCVAAKAKRK